MNTTTIKTKLVELIEKDSIINSLTQKSNELKDKIKSEDKITDIDQINKIRKENIEPVKKFDEYNVKIDNLKTERKNIEKILTNEIDIDGKKLEIDLAEHGKYSIEKIKDFYNEEDPKIEYSKLS